MGRSHTKLLRRQRKRATAIGIRADKINPRMLWEKAELRRPEYTGAKPGAEIKLRTGQPIDKALKLLKKFDNRTGEFNLKRKQQKQTREKLEW
jgi:hypothetical protein